MFKKIIFLFIFLFLPIIVNAEEAVQIELSVSDDEVSVGDSFQVLVDLKNISTGNLNIGDIKIPGIEKFQQVGSSKSTQIQMINGATTAVTETTLTLVALNEGEYEIGPIETEFNNLSIKSNNVRIRVIKKEKNSFFSSRSDQENVISRASSQKESKTYKDLIINLIAGSLLLGMIYAFYKQRHSSENYKENKQELSEKTIADFQVKIPDQEDDKFFEKAKSLILENLQKKYSIDTEVLTSNEVIEELKRKKIQSVNDIKKILELCDQGNFAALDSNKEIIAKLIKKTIA